MFVTCPVFQNFNDNNKIEETNELDQMRLNEILTFHVTKTLRKSLAFRVNALQTSRF